MSSWVCRPGCRAPSKPMGHPSNMISAACPSCNAATATGRYAGVRGAATRRQRGFHIGFEVVEIPRLAPAPLFRGDAPATQAAQHGRLRQRAIAAVEDLAGLKQPRPRLLPVEVAAQGRQEPGPQADAHPRHVGGNGVKQGQTLRVGKQQGLQGRIDKTVGDGLLVAPFGQGPPQGGDAGLLPRGAHGPG